jgi:hypothetical protein
MRTVLLIAVAAFLPAIALADPPPRPGKPLPPTTPRAAVNPCAAFGPGFVSLDGSSTCVRLGGGIGAGTGTGTGR